MKTIFIVMFSLCVFTASAQHQLTGTVKDAADGSSLPYATAVLLRPDSSVVKGVITGDDGKFVIQNVAAGDYLLQVSFIGYEKSYHKVNVPAQSDLGDIVLAESANKLKEVVVNAARPLVVNHADRYVVNVSGNIQSAGRDALDILRNTPGVLVNRGNISVMGNSVKIWIDGRPSRMSGEQLRTFLNSMQGGEIDRIEVITNPSSRYDAAGSGGIIDIRTKKGLQYGVNGTLTAGYQQGRKNIENAGVNINWRREKFNVFGNYSIKRGNNWEKLGQINIMQTSVGPITFDQNTTIESSKPYMYHQYRAGMDYFINPKNILGVIVIGYNVHAQNDSKGITNILPAYDGASFSTSNNIQSGSMDGIQVNINYQAKFDKPGKQLNLDVDYARFGSDPFQQITNRYYDPGGLMLDAPEQFRNNSPRTTEVYSAKIDYVQPLWKDARMETGTKFTQSKTDNDLKYDKYINSDWQIDAGKTNRFVYTEQIGAAYINISQRLGKFNLQAGLRGEYTLPKGEQKTTGEVNDTSYFNLFPTFFVNWQASKKHNFGLSYSRRLSRPNYGHLNTFELILDAYSFDVGNPDLMPSYTHNVQLSHTFGQNLMTRIGYSNTTDAIIRIPIEDDSTQPKRYGTTYGNFGKTQSVSAMVNYRKTFVKIWTINLTVSGGYDINTSNEVSGKYTNKGGSFTVQLNNNLTITPSLSAEITALYISGMYHGYTVIQPRGNFSIGLRQMLLKNKLSLSLTIDDILYTSIDKSHAQYENIDYSSYFKRDSRYVNLTLRYHFGSTTVRAARSKASSMEDEARRAGN